MDEAIEKYFLHLGASNAAPSTIANTKNQIRQLRKALGPHWEGWLTGYWRHIDTIRMVNTRNCRRRAANVFAKFHLTNVPDFRAVTDVNRPGERYVADGDAPSTGGKSYKSGEAAAMLPHIPALPDFMQDLELLGVYMG